ncbi:gastric triacylglycerol lipase-like [Aphis gossypii]|uniref:gastric triacylglycerol lipase-like n=1 Tax=Aphis gossypii TaxID=80765 RepID=UPI002158E77D|nr:gastric triacylglycerol lipase-like [Aphis gossypii]
MKMILFFNLIIFFNVFIATISSSNAYIPDASLSVPKIIKRHGYPSETHIVDTKDGYLLEVHRIPHGKNIKQYRNFPVFLQHGVVASSADWIINGPKKALAYQLADNGFDVWLGNSRGNTYSRTHKSLSPDSEEFWNFSFHEMGIYDLPATIDYVLERTNRSQLYYIGHSMGSCMFFVMCSMRPEYNYKIRAQISLAPVAYVHHMTSVLNSLVPYATQIQKASNWVSKGAFLPQNAASKLVNKYLCGDNAMNSALCKKYIVYKMFGEDSVQFDMVNWLNTYIPTKCEIEQIQHIHLGCYLQLLNPNTMYKLLLYLFFPGLLPIILGHNPAGTSVKTLIHFAQEITTKNFQQFDFGIEKNLEVYNCSHPPKYNLSNVIAPIAFYYAKNDILADPLDVVELYSRLPNRLGINLIKFDQFNHVDFLYSKNVTEMVYQSVMNTLFKAEFADWIPEIDNTTAFNVSSDYNQCYDERNARKTKNGFWQKITSFIKRKEVYPLKNYMVEDHEENVRSRHTIKNAWNQTHFE